MEHMAQTITGNYNAFMGTVTAIISVIFGKHWYLFALFLTLDIADWVASWMKSRIMKRENSVRGWQGMLKKTGYWIMITFAFMVITSLIEVDEIAGIGLQITTLLGWFILASSIVNKAHFTYENFVGVGFNIPEVLSNDLAATDKLINKESKGEE